MIARAHLAGILTLISLVIPWNLTLGSGYLEFDWALFSYVDLGRFGSSFYNLTQFAGLEIILSLISFVVLVTGAVLLLAARRPKIGGVTVLAGLLISIIGIVYYEIVSGGFALIPVGIFFAIASSIIGMTEKVPVSSPSVTQELSSVDRIIRLKALLDSGVITREEFEEQKKIILQKDAEM